MLNAVLLGVCVLSAGLLTLHKMPVFTQNTGEFQITQLLQNENNPSIVAFNVYGTFEENDVVNIYSSETFIKGKLINTPELIGTKEITIGNISTDIFQKGENLIVAKIERNGSEVSETQPFHLTIQEPPGKPTVMALVNEEKKLIAIDVTGDFEENDVVKIFLNGNEITARTLSSNEVLQREMRVAGIEMGDLQTGENYFEASILRNGHESEKSEKSEKIIVEEMAEEPEVAPPQPQQQIISTEQCIEYSDPQRIIAGTGNKRDGFGVSVDVKDGVFAVGTKTEKSYIHNKSSAGWLYPTTVFEQELTGSGSINRSVAVYDNGTVIIADPSSWYRGQSAGAVYIYRRFGKTWTKYTTIAPQDLVPHDEFGTNIALNPQTLAVSALQPDKSGSVYMYTRAGGLWNNPVRIVPQDTKPDQEFGYSISVSGSHLAIGAPGDGGDNNGAVYLYTRSSNGWTPVKITPQNRRLNARFGTSVLVRGDVLFVGAMRDEQGTYSDSGSGVVYVYAQYGDAWHFIQKLKPQMNDNSGKFGAALAYSDDGSTLAVGAPESNAEKDNAGAAYIFTRTKENPAMWELKEIAAPDEVRRGDEFGSSIDFEGLNLFIGAYGRDVEERNAGAVYLYSASIVPCVEEVPESADQTIASYIETTPRNLLESLKQKKEVVDRLAATVTMLTDLLGNSIEGVYNEITRKDENIVVYDESMAHEFAQKRAAEKRGIIGPMLPEEVKVKVVDSAEKISKIAGDTIRTRNTVVQETEEKLGVVVPVTTRDFRRGNVHEEVYRLQVFLNEAGYRVADEGPGSPGKETSTFTKETENALRSFQIIRGLPPTGVLDKQTRNEILTFIK